MTVLLAGGAGYIGSHTAVEFLNSGYDVVIVDNYSNSSPDVIEKIKKITGKNLKVYEADVEDKEKLGPIFKENRIDAVIHFAGFKAVGESVAKPLMYYRNNLDSTLTLLETMQEYKVNNIIFSSSATVYGVDAVPPYTETYNTGNCTNPYSWTKFMIEKILEGATVANKDLSVVSLRYFNPVGAHESGLIGENPKGIPNNLMPFIAQVAAGKLKELSVFGNDYPTKDGTGVRDYIHVTDLAKGHVLATDYAIKNKGFDAINLGTGVGYSVIDIVNSFIKINNINVPYKIVDRRPGDIAEFYADAKKAKEKLGWRAEKNLEDMCRDTWNFQKNLI